MRTVIITIKRNGYIHFKFMFSTKHMVLVIKSTVVISLRQYLTFCGFPWVETSTAGRVYDLCVYYMTGAPEGSPKVVLCGFMVFMEKPGIEPVNQGSQVSLLYLLVIS